MFEQSFKNIDNILRKDAGSSSELDYIEQTSWILFLKYLDDLEEDRKKEAMLAGKPLSRAGSLPQGICVADLSVERDCCKVCLDSHCPH